MSRHSQTTIKTSEGPSQNQQSAMQQCGVEFIEVDEEPEIVWQSTPLNEEEIGNLRKSCNLDFQFYGRSWDDLSLEQTDTLLQKHHEKAKCLDMDAYQVPYPVKSLYNKAYVKFQDPEDNFTIQVGNYARVTSEHQKPDGDQYFWVCQIIAMFADIKDQEWYHCEWYWVDMDLPLKIEDEQGYFSTPTNLNLLPRKSMFRNRIWKEKNNSVHNCSLKFPTIEKLVSVIHISPGADPPEYFIVDQVDADGAYDRFWCDQSTSQEYWTYQDLNTEPAKYESRDLQVLDMFCGCGGTSFIELGSTDKVNIRSLWAVDVEKSMTRTYKLNNPNCEVYNLRVQELYAIIKKVNFWKEQFRNAGYDIAYRRGQQQLFSIDGFQIVEVSIQLSAEYYKERDSIDADDLEFSPSLDQVEIAFLIKRQKVEVWFQDDDLYDACPKLFALWLQNQQQVPVVGQVDVIVGGPPCQGISGMNKNNNEITTSELFKGRLNGMITWFFKFIQLLKPTFVLMEQVQQVFQKNQGLYIKAIQWWLLQLRYQSRIGICHAGGYGCPQTRARVFLWAAKPGEQLPPFPEPIHHIQKSVPLSNDDCFVFFQTQESCGNAYPPLVMGDILKDLPEVCNFGYNDVNEVQPIGLESSPYLFWLRSPPQSQHSLLEKINKRGLVRLELDYKDVSDLVQLGSRFFGNFMSGFESEIQSEIVQSDEEVQEVVDEELLRVKLDVGHKILESVKSNKNILSRVRMDLFKEGEGEGEEVNKSCNNWISDLRCVPFSYDNYMRACNIPKGAGACFLHLPGVHYDSYTRRFCCGHFHTCQMSGDAMLLTRSTKRKHGLLYEEPIEDVLQIRACPSKTTLIPGTLRPLCRTSFFKLKNGRTRAYGTVDDHPFAASAYGQRAPFSRIWYGDAIATVFAQINVTVSQCLHPEQDRYLSIREVARAQGFPDHFVFDWDPESDDVRRRDCPTLLIRHRQIGNAVSPVMAMHLGRCLALAAAGDVPTDVPVIPVRDTIYDQLIQDAKRQGLMFYFERGVQSGYKPSIYFAKINGINIRQNEQEEQYAGQNVQEQAGQSK